MATNSAGISDQVTTLARTRLGGCMWPSWQHEASPHSGSALIPGPVTARSCRTGSGVRRWRPSTGNRPRSTACLSQSPRNSRRVAPSALATKVAAIAAALLAYRSS